MQGLTPERLQVLIILIVFFGVLMGFVSYVVVRSARRGPQIETKPPEQIPDMEQPSEREVAEVAEEPEEPVLVQVDPYKKTQNAFWGRVKTLFGNDNGADLEELEEILYTSDLGPKTVERLMEEIGPVSKQGLGPVKAKIQEEFERIFAEANVPEPLSGTLDHLDRSAKPAVWMIVGVNGAGKTTTIGKISAQLAAQGLKVLVAAGDTFRAAAGSQLKVWTDRAQVEIFSPEGITDPSAVAFDAVAKAKARDYDIVLIDTAGRLHTQAPLMEELKKVKRVITKVIPEAPHETLIVLDANNGQNALHQAREFNAALGLTGVILTKMDGTAKGGVAVGLSHELKIPIRLIGVGEKVQDLKPFSSREFIDSILGEA